MILETRDSRRQVLELRQHLASNASWPKGPNPVAQIAQSRQYKRTLGPNVGIIYILGALGKGSKQRQHRRTLAQHADLQTGI